MVHCILPWINFGTNTFGRARVCGYSSNKSPLKLQRSTIDKEWNNEYFSSIRKDFVNGIWPENCQRCKYVEEHSGTSKRLEENSAWHETYKELIQDTNADGTVNYYPPHIDIRTGTICNLKCIHCGTGASSKWKEDTILLNKYPNTEDYIVNNVWIEEDYAFWDNLIKMSPQILRYNFLGGESFANKRHNEFIRYLSDSEYAKNVSVSYVSNGTLIHKNILSQLAKFKSVKISVSIDAIGSVAEYFRFPLKWDIFIEKLNMLVDFIKDKPNFDVGFQWTASNVSMFYLVDTYDFFRTNFPSIKFIFCNHVDWPYHMSPQVLPLDVKASISQKIKDYNWHNISDYKFYVTHMNEKDSWNEYSTIFLEYIDDIDAARSICWIDSMPDLYNKIKRNYE